VHEQRRPPLRLHRHRAPAGLRPALLRDAGRRERRRGAVAKAGAAPPVRADAERARPGRRHRLPGQRQRPRDHHAPDPVQLPVPEPGRRGLHAPHGVPRRRADRAHLHVLAALRFVPGRERPAVHHLAGHPARASTTGAGAAARTVTPPAPSRLRRAAREPLLHFALLGAALFALYGALHGGRRGGAADDRAGAGGDRPVVTVDAATLDRLTSTFRHAWKREPERDELAEMTLDFVDEDILFRQALALHLDRDDPAVRRRLIEKMTVMQRPAAPPPEPAPGELGAWYASRRHHFREPARFWL